LETADVVIAGGGIVGSAVAYFLSTDAATRGRRIVLVERDPGYREASTARSAGGIRQQFSTPENIAMSQFTLGMFRQLEAIFGPGADIAFREQGYLIMATPEGQPLLSDNVALQQSMGADVALLGVADLTRAFPWLATGGVAAAGFGRTGEGWFDPTSLATLFRKAAAENGVGIVHDRVTAIGVRGRVESVSLASGKTIACRNLVNAAGPWAGALSAMAGLELPVEPRKRFVYVIDCREASDALHLAPLTVDPSGVWFRPEGRVFLCGRSPEEDEEPPVGDLDVVDHAFFEQKVWPRLAARVPAFETVKVINAWAGYYDTNTLDQNAVIGPHPEVPNFFFANGFSGHGAQQAAAAGRAIAELIGHSAFQTLDLTRLGYARIVNNAPLAEHNVI
jgi:FAD-dependent oxidoreductase domain-containing protein 1